MFMENAATGVKRQVLGGLHRLWCFLFSWVYYAVKGMWGWAFLSFITFNGLVIGFPLYNRRIVRGWYENNGWRITQGP
jgi:hypothetical protein